jgi:transposase InsO family protein
MCTVLEISRSGFYAWLNREPSDRSKSDARMLDLIREVHKANREIYGSPRVHEALKAGGVECGRNRTARLMREAGLRSKTKKKFKATTNSKHSHPVAPNLLGQDFKTQLPNAIWVSDITYIWTDEGWLYLATTMDLFSRGVVGWSMDSRMKSSLVVSALDMALKAREPMKGLIHHSDRGVQYAAKPFQELLSSNGIVCSMSRKGNCYDNAVQESFYHSLKTELVHHEHYRTREQARASLFEYIEGFYNRVRLHSTLGYKSPLQFELEHDGQQPAA